MERLPTRLGLFDPIEGRFHHWVPQVGNTENLGGSINWREEMEKKKTVGPVEEYFEKLGPGQKRVRGVGLLALWAWREPTRR